MFLKPTGIYWRNNDKSQVFKFIGKYACICYHVKFKWYILFTAGQWFETYGTHYKSMTFIQFSWMVINSTTIVWSKTRWKFMEINYYITISRFKILNIWQNLSSEFTNKLVVSTLAFTYCNRAKRSSHKILIYGFVFIFIRCTLNFVSNCMWLSVCTKVFNTNNKKLW